MTEDLGHRKKGGLARRLFRAVGQAGSTVTGVAGGLLRSAGQTAKNAGGRASLTFASDVEETTPADLRELAESLTQWLVQQHQGKADLQQQRPSSVELTELGQVGTFYEVRLEEPGLAGRQFRFIFRQRPLSDYAGNFPEVGEHFDEEVLITLTWPQTLDSEPDKEAIIVWDHACLLGRRNPAIDVAQHWLKEEAGGTFVAKRVRPKGTHKAARPIPLFGRDEELSEIKSILLSPRPRDKRGQSLVSLAAPGGTGKSFFLKALQAEVGHRVVWAGVDHQGIEKETSSLGLLGRFLAQLAQSLEEQSVRMEGFSKELRSFKKRVDAATTGESSGFFGHLKKAAETAAGVNPILGAVSAGVVFLTSWGQEAKEESEALAKDNAVKALTDAFKSDITSYVKAARKESICWSRPVIVFDTYEWLAPLVDTWMRTEFLAGEFLQETGVVVILSGREHLLRIDTRWSEWQHLVTKVSLMPFDLSTTKEYLTSLEVSQDRVDKIFELTEGLPLFLSLAAHMDEHDQAVGVLAKRVLEEVDVENRDDFLRASVLDSFDRGTLQTLFSEKSEEQLEAVTQLLGKATFTVANDGKRAFLGPVRRILKRALVLDLGENAVQELESRVSKV
jgi:hypothetical protein